MLAKKKYVFEVNFDRFLNFLIVIWFFLYFSAPIQPVGGPEACNIYNMQLKLTDEFFRIVCLFH